MLTNFSDSSGDVFKELERKPTIVGGDSKVLQQHGDVGYDFSISFAQENQKITSGIQEFPHVIQLYWEEIPGTRCLCNL
jgi:hypothetical protein